MNEKHYYSLRLLGTNAFHAKNDVLKTTNRVLHIGETADCEIRYETKQFEPERFATIIENEDGKSWSLIQRSQYVQTIVAGIGGFGIVHQLKDGDVISFEGYDMEIEFHSHHDNNYGKAGIVIEQYSSKRLTYSILSVIVIAILAFASLLYYSFENRESQVFVYDGLNEFLPSVFMIRVDSVQWIEVSSNDTTQIRPTLVTDIKGAVGTAFLTTDAKLVTARHCIEYWIGKDIDLRLKINTLDDNDIVKWAILSEKFMQERDSEEVSQHLRVFFSIYNPQMPDRPVYRLSSTDACVHINRSHDISYEMADFSDSYYWRTVFPLFNKSESELGDIVYIDVDNCGKIELADSTAIAQLTQSSAVGIIGFPNNSSGRRATFASGYIKEDRTDSIHAVSPDIIFDANITHGFSGGPVFIRTHDKRIVAAGVVSKIDVDNGIYKKAVPVTEITYMERNGEEVGK